MSSQSRQSGVWVVFMVVGMMLNTLGISLPKTGGYRYFLMALGLLLLLAAVTFALRDARRGGEAES